MIPGLFIETDWITRERERELADALGDGADRGVHSVCGRHRIDRYGAGVVASGYRTGNVCLEVPACLGPLRAELEPVLDANAITVAWYAPGDVVRPHADRKTCGEVIVVVSLLSDAVMRMSPWSKDPSKSQDFLVPRRSLLIMRGEARHDWLHEILPVHSLRIAIVFRQAAL